MTYLYVEWLADVLRAAGIKVSEVGGWQNRGRPSSSGAFNPFGVLIHHTGTTSSASNPAPTLNVCINGRSDLPGPLCHVLVGYDGLAHVIAAGRANHAGECRGSGPIPPGDGNAEMIGIEIDYNGTQTMSATQYDASIRAAAAICAELGVDAEHVRGHKETSTTGKWDPGGYDMRAIRADVTAASNGSADDMPLTAADLDNIANELANNTLFLNQVARFVWTGAGGVAGAPSYMAQSASKTAEEVARELANDPEFKNQVARYVWTSAGGAEPGTPSYMNQSAGATAAAVWAGEPGRGGG